VNMLTTIEDILGLDHLNINTATQRPMTEVFDLSQREWTYTATASDFLKSTQLPIPANAFASTDKTPKPLHDSVYWAEKTAEFDFSVEDNSRTRTNSIGSLGKASWAIARIQASATGRIYAKIAPNY